ncbi:ELL-associated factor 1-like [Liolophura sinensis]|uniref:ELL-associated factor 1-like n=1 Tax=Liolophura sinensis TaxID=3198878 RepID=UPI0031593E90
MADKSLRIDNDVHELVLGESFKKGSSVGFHSIRYDFKPASVDTTEDASVEVGENHQVTVALPHVQGSGTSHTVYKGNKRPCPKECVLIIDHDTGTYTLERLSTHIQLKKTRIEGSSKIGRPVTPVEQTMKSKSSPSKKSSHSSPVPKADSPPTQSYMEVEKDAVATPTSPMATGVGVMSDSSSEGSSSDSDSSDEDEKAKTTTSQGNSNGTVPAPATKFMSMLSQDLQLSDTGSDSD